MSNPITWRNVNAPNFGASNTLAMNATQQLGNAFDSMGDRLIGQGEYNEEKNTDAFAAKLGQYSNYDDLQGAKANLFAGVEGTNIDNSAILDSFNKYSGQLGDQEQFQTQRKDTADTEAGNAFARQLMNNGVTNQREVQSAVMAEGVKQGWSDTSTGNVFSSITRDFAATPEEAAAATAATSLLDYQREVALQTQEDTAKNLRERIKAGKSSGKFSSLIDGAKSPMWKQLLPGDGDAWAQRNAEAFLSKADVQVGSRTAKEIYARHTDGGVTDFGAADEELAQTAAVQQQIAGANLNDPVARKLTTQSVMKQMNVSEEEAQALVDHVIKQLK